MTSPMPTLPPEAEAIVEPRLIDRNRATWKLRDVLARAAAGEGPTASIRTISVLGSYARGAKRLGDVDLTIEVDDPREPNQARFDDYLDFVRGRRPQRELLRTLKCSGSSMVSVTVVRRCAEDRTPVAPERWRPELAEGHVRAEPPAMAHVVTGQPLAGPSILLFVRGDSLGDALARLDAIPVDPVAARYERTTGVPLLDPLTEHLGVEVQYRLAEFVRAGAVDIEAVVLRPSERVPAAVLRHQAATNVPLPGGRNRRLAVQAAIDHLRRDGIQPSRLSIDGVSLTPGGTDPDVLVDWSATTLYALSDRFQLSGYSRVLFIGRAHTIGPWIALNCQPRDRRAMDEVERARRLAW